MDKIKVVLIDDHTILRQSLACALARDEEIEVPAHWSNAEEAIPFFYKKECDVAIIDHILPGMDGITMTENIKRLSPNTQVIILSMFGKEEDILKAFESGASGYIPKESSLEELVDAIKKVHKGESILSDRVTKRFIKYCTLIDKRGTRGAILSEDQIQILKMASMGNSNRKIASQMGVGIGVIKNRFHEIFDILQAKDRTHAVIIALRLGFIDLDENED